jgi:hypothetical protein
MQAPGNFPGGRQGTQMRKDLPTLEGAKAQAKALRAGLRAAGQEVSHSAALELIAKTHGHRDWNTLHAAIGNGTRAPVAFGQVVSGRYLGQAFVAEVLGIKELSHGRYELKLQLAEPVDVVRFDSFSLFRSRVVKTVGPDGRSFDKTSDGVPHLVLEI